MSFIYKDENLINDLLKCGIDFESKFSKQGQANTDKANLQLLISNLEKEVGTAKIELPLTQELDRVSQIFSDKNTNTNGDISLTFGDLQGAQSFNRWVQSNNIQVIINDKRISSNDQQFDPSVIVKSLHNRAQFLLRTKSTDDPSQTMYTAYVQSVESLSSSITGPDGKSVDLGGTATQNTDSADQSLAKLPSTLPLNDSNIDFENIETFFGVYENVIKDNKDLKAKDRVNEATRSIDLARRIMRNNVPGRLNVPMLSFPMTISVSPDEVAGWLKNPGSNYLPFLLDLSQIIMSVSNVINNVARSYGNQIGMEHLQSQISIYNRQANIIRNLQSRANTLK